MPTDHRGRRVRTAVRVTVSLVVFTAVVAGAAMGIAAWLGRSDHPPRVVRCAAHLEGTNWFLETDQAETTALLAGTALQRGLPARALTIAIATGLQESKLRNIDYGDRDSVGIFQQRPSQGWGTAEQIMDPVYSTNRFYDALVRVDGYQDMPITVAAQAVQRSAFPDAYAQHETRARAWASALYGYSARTITCTLPPADPGDPDGFAERVSRDLGLTATTDASSASVEAGPLVADAEHLERLGWSVAHWAVMVAEPFGVTEVRHAGSVWDRTSGGWQVTDDPEGAAGRVVVVFAE